MSQISPCSQPETQRPGDSIQIDAAEFPSKGHGPSPEPQPHSTTHWEPSRVVPGPHFLIQKVGKGSEGSLWGLQRGGWRPILARLRRADGRWYGRPGEAEGRGCGAEIFELADAVGSLRGQPVCRGMYGRATDRNGRLLSPEEVARACGLSRRAVYRAIARGELQAARLCNRLRVQPTELERWIGEQTVAPEASTPTRPRMSAETARPGSLRALLGGTEEAGGDRP